MGSGSASRASSASVAHLRAAYLDLMRGYLPGVPDVELLAIGRGVCREFDAGHTWAQIVASLVRGGMVAQTARVAATAAVVAFCPRRRP